MPFHKFLERHLVTCVHALIRGCHRSCVARITLIHQMLEKGSDIELLILRHPGDFLGYLGQLHDGIFRQKTLEGK